MRSRIVWSGVLTKTARGNLQSVTLAALSLRRHSPMLETPIDGLDISSVGVRIRYQVALGDLTEPRLIVPRDGGKSPGTEEDPTRRTFNRSNGANLFSAAPPLATGCVTHHVAYLCSRRS